MTIEPTHDMVQLIYQRIDFVQHDDSGIREGLEDVFALVERDYHVTPRSSGQRRCACPPLKCFGRASRQPYQECVAVLARDDAEGLT